MIDFYAPLHQYTDRDTGEVIPSVTQILKAAGIIDDRFYTEEARDRGSAVHTLCERYAKGERTDAKGRPLASLEYVNAFVKWMDEADDDGTELSYMKTEGIIEHELFGIRYCGKYDIFCEQNGTSLLVDIKTGAPAKWHLLQLAAYALAINPTYIMDLYLSADGTYSERVLSPRALLYATDEWKAALVAAKQKQEAWEWRQKNEV
jgi:RecB family exonuclease